MRSYYQVQWVGYQTIVRKELTRIFRIWSQTLLPSAITMSLYFLIFGNFLGERVGEVQGTPYIQFIASGLIMMSIINNSYTNASSSLFSAKFQGSIEEVLSSPLSYTVILWGHVSAAIARGAMVAVITMTVAAFFSAITFYQPLLIVISALLTAILFALAGFSNALFAKSFDDISIIPTFILTPLTYLGGVFFSISQFSPFWQKVCLLNPILYLVNLFRFGFLGKADVDPYLALAVLSGFCIGLFTLNLWMLNKGYGLKD